MIRDLTLSHQWTNNLLSIFKKERKIKLHGYLFTSIEQRTSKAFMEGVYCILKRWIKHIEPYDYKWAYPQQTTDNGQNKHRRNASDSSSPMNWLRSLFWKLKYKLCSTKVNLKECFRPLVISKQKLVQKAVTMRIKLENHILLSQTETKRSFNWIIFKEPNHSDPSFLVV